MSSASHVTGTCLLMLGKSSLPAATRLAVSHPLPVLSHGRLNKGMMYKLSARSCAQTDHFRKHDDLACGVLRAALAYRP
jgi:hypothetical protein